MVTAFGLAACGGSSSATPNTPEADSNKAAFDQVKGCLEQAGFPGDQSVIGQDGALLDLTIPPGTDYPKAEITSTLDYSSAEADYTQSLGFGLLAESGDPTALAFGYRPTAAPALRQAIYDCANRTGFALPADASPALKRELPNLSQ